MTDLGILNWAVIALCGALIGMSKTGLPGAGILVVPLMASAVDAKASVGLLLPMLIVGDVFAVGVHRRHAEWSRLVPLLPWTALGILAGWLALGRLDSGALRPFIGATILGMLALNRWRRRLQSADGDGEGVPHSRLFAPSMGVAAGVLTMMANAAGPVMVIYLLAMRLPKREFVGTSAWFFFMVNLFKVPMSAQLGLITRDSLVINLVSIPAIAAGAWLGVKLLDRIPQDLFNRVVVALAVVASLRLMLP